MKFTPVVSAARSSERAMSTGFSFSPSTSATGVTEMRLFTIGMPNSRSIASPTATSRSARRVTRS